MSDQHSGVLTWLGGVDAGSADHLGRGGAKRDLNGALLCGRELLHGRLLVLLGDWLVVLWRRGLWSLMHRRRLSVRAEEAGRHAGSYIYCDLYTHTHIYCIYI